jgi:hypothetical protein
MKKVDLRVLPTLSSRLPKLLRLPLILTDSSSMEEISDLTYPLVDLEEVPVAEEASVAEEAAEAASVIEAASEADSAVAVEASVAIEAAEAASEEVAEAEAVFLTKLRLPTKDSSFHHQTSQLDFEPAIK